MANLIDRLTSWWFGDGDTPDAPRYSARVSPPLPQESGSDADRLHAILARQARVSAGSVHLLGLESLKERLGARWPAVRDRVRQLVERLLSQVLGAHDAAFPYGPDTYLVVFARLDEREAGLVCARILQDLQLMLLGDADTSSIVVRTAVRQVTGDLVMKPQRLADLLSAATAAPASEEGSSPPRWFDMPAGGAAVGTAPVVVSPSVSDDPQWVPLPSQGRPRPEVSTMPVPVPAESALPAFQPEEVAAAWSAHTRLGPLSIVYRPVWDAIHQSVGLYVARGCRMRRGGERVYGCDTIPQLSKPGVPSPETLQAIQEMDEEAMRQAIGVFLELYDSKARFFLSLPVHYETLAGLQRRRSYVALASRIPAHLIPFLTYHLVGLPEGTPTGRLADFVMALRPYGRNLMVELGLRRCDMTTLAAAGVKGVGVVLPKAHGQMPSGRGRSDRLVTDLGLVATEARRHQLKLYVEGVDSVETEGMVDRVGADFMAGDLIGGWTERPRDTVRLSRVDLLSNTRRSPE
ncbi:GGDEF domain-containing protein [Azospirillum sp. B4]|uniref:GGDEF domain-containing protein n=1 Tax=Azospirillum sp. B4 TaxID=95605 RepID=UPI00034AE6E0|nr:GGDEF domain-containing protein [Azospirillum sp. B4]